VTGLHLFVAGDLSGLSIDPSQDRVAVDDASDAIVDFLIGLTRTAQNASHHGTGE
jgi:hypothetical protein